MNPIRAVCLDIDGTLTDGVGGPPIAGAVDAVRAIRARYPVRFVTNASSLPRAALERGLREAGFEVRDGELYTPAVTARSTLTARGHDRGVLLADDPTDFSWFTETAAPGDGGSDTVLLCTEGHGWTLGRFQPAFRRLLDGATFYSLTGNRYFRHEGQLVTDLGPLVAFFRYATGRDAEVLGKPSPLLFDAVAREAGVPRDALVMVGDDVEFDVVGARALGMRGVLVRTGKFRESDAARMPDGSSAVVDSIADLPDWLGR